MLVVPLVKSKINAFICLFFKNTGLRATTIVYRCLLMFICVCFFHIPALLGEGFGLSGCAISRILGTLGVPQLQTS